MGLDVAADNSPECPDQIVHLTGVGAAYSVGHTDTVDTDLVDSPVNGQQIDQLGSERVLGRETDLDPLGLDELDDLDGAASVSGCVFQAMHDAYVLVIQVMSLPWECSRRNDDVPMTTSTPSTPVL
jgi:hypothetical protein